ncbi:hypothetical protein, partial [Rhizobium leguminosarum]|uniref:hypothetical protein n=1 Tax=Rhizobium leguminosarum TaxID=384 RepID=UPI003F97020E
FLRRFYFIQLESFRVITPNVDTSNVIQQLISCLIYYWLLIRFGRRSCIKQLLSATQALQQSEISMTEYQAKSNNSLSFELTKDDKLIG